MRFSKKRLIKEFDDAAPALKKEILDAPIITADGADVKNGATLAKKRAGVFALCAVAIVAAIFAFLGIFGVFSPSAPFDKFVILIEINPSAAFVANKDGNVVSVNSLNGDADVILSDEEFVSALESKPLSDAVVSYADRAARLGYLDTSEKCAVRLSGCTETDEVAISAASDGLRDYFRKKGVYAAVVEDLISADEMSERAGLEKEDDLDGLVERIRTLPTLYGERGADGANPKQLDEMYRSYIIGGQLFDLVQSELLSNVNGIIENARLLTQIGVCNYNIMLHKGNPLAPIPADYWTVLKFPNAEYGKEFSAKMEEMRALLKEYESAFGKTIEGSDELIAAAEVYSSLAGVDLKELFDGLTSSEFSDSADKYVKMLKNIGCDVYALETALKIPATADEYVLQLQSALEQVSLSKAERFEDDYNRPRDEISESDYDDFINSVINEFGSLENFWNKK